MESQSGLSIGRRTTSAKLHRARDGKTIDFGIVTFYHRNPIINYFGSRFIKLRLEFNLWLHNR